MKKIIYNWKVFKTAVNHPRSAANSLHLVMIWACFVATGAIFIFFYKMKLIMFSLK